MYNSIICRYHEIALKSANRGHFEKCLGENLRMLFAPLAVKIRRVRGRIWVEKPGRDDFTAEEMAHIGRRMEKAFGVESWSPARLLPPDMEAVRAAFADMAPPLIEDALKNSGGEAVSFRIRARRSDKNFPLNSNQIEIELATLLGDRFGDGKLRIDLDHAAITFGVEIRDEMAVLFLETRKGPGGLPVGSNSKVLALLSGGIDSPVACYLAMKRGSAVEYLSFHSAPYTPPETTEKVTRIAAYLNTFEKPGRLALCNLSPMQKLIRDHCSPRMRTVLYRRMMLRIAARVAGQFHCEALLTGDSLGQVASQTVVNMATIDRATEMLVIRPLVGQDKLETIRWAEKIGTFELSKEQVPDSCTVFAPDHPATAAEHERVVEEEAKLGDYEKLLDEIAAAIEVIRP